MKREEALQIIDTAVETLSMQLNEGKSASLKAFLDAMARFPQYSFRNMLLILSQNPNATQVAGFHTWRKLGRLVRKGEHGIAILAPLVGTRKDSEAEAQNANAHSTTGKCLFGFRVAYVFDVTQTEGEELPMPVAVQGDPGAYLERLKNLVKKLEIALVYESMAPGMQGASTGGKIILQPHLCAAEEFSVLVHELAHELLHRKGRDTLRSKTVRETEAEAVAYVVNHAIGLHTDTASSDYIQLYNGTKETLAQSMSYIQQASMEILTSLLGN